MNRWEAFSTEELRTLLVVLEEHCERYEDTCEAEADLIDEIAVELSGR